VTLALLTALAFTVSGGPFDPAATPADQRRTDAVLSFTAPSHLALAGGVTVQEPAALTVQLATWRQSQLWKDLHVEMERSPALWQLLWPRVRQQALLEYQVERSARVAPGERVSFADLPSGAYRVRAIDAAWNRGAWSKWRSVP
jgi:hypothetical protein